MKRQVFLKTKTKVAAAVFAAAMTVSGAAPVISMTIPVMAEGTDDGTGSTTNTNGTTTTEIKNIIGVSGVEDGATVKAYQLVKGSYTTDGKLKGYSLTTLGTQSVDGTAISLSDLVKYSDTEEGNTEKLAKYVTTVANAIGTNKTEATYTLTKDTSVGAVSGTYKVAAEPGLYIVLVTGTNSATVYNPVLLAVNVPDANKVSDTASGQTIAINTAFRNGKGTAYMKSSTTGFDKNITNITTKDNGVENTTASKTGKGDALAIGDEAEFKIDKMIIPSYSDDYESVVYKISDTLESTGFENISDLTVKVGTDNTEKGTTATTLTIDGTSIYTDAAKTTKVADLTGGNGNKSFTIAFTSDYIKGLAAKSAEDRAVEITYKAKLATTAGLNYAENYNHATLEYSNDPTDTSKTEKKTANTYHYTFGIDANIDGEATETTTGEKKWETHELNKVTTESGESAFEETTTTYSQTQATSTRKSTSALKGAQFTLYTDAKCETAAKALITTTTGDTSSTTMADAVATSDENGHISFLGLDEGTYYMKETQAPESYTISDKVYKIVIDATFGDDGVMTSYSITTYDTSVANYGTEVTEKDPTTGAETKKILGLVGSATYANTEYKVVNDGSVTNAISKESETAITPVEIVNTKVQTLPFTGGEGRYAIYLTAAALGGAMIVLVGLKKKEDKKEA